MAQNFRRRITLLPNSFGKNLNSAKNYKEIDLEEKADEDTFNKSTNNKFTPKKKTKSNDSLLESPIIERDKRLRRISIHSPISFNDNSLLKNSPNNFGTNFFNDFDNFCLGSFLDKNISNFKCHFSPENCWDSPNFDSLEKIKKSNNKENKTVEKTIILNDDENNNYLFSVYNDRDIYGNNYIIDQDNAMMRTNFNDNYNSDEENIKNGQEMCLSELKEAIYNYSCLKSK